MKGLDADEGSVPFLRFVAFQPKSYEAFNETLEQLLGFQEIYSNCCNSGGWNATRIVVRLVELPDGQTMLVISDNGRAKEDTPKAALENASSLLSHSKVECSPLEGRSEETDFSVNGVGMQAALKRLAPEVLHLIGRWIVVRQGIGYEGLASERDGCRKARPLVAPFDVNAFLECHNVTMFEFTQQMALVLKDPEMGFKALKSGIRDRNEPDPLTATNLKSLVPLEGLVNPNISEEMRARQLRILTQHEGVVPLKLQELSFRRDFVAQHQQVRGSCTGFTTALLNPWGVYKPTEDGGDFTFAASAESEPCSMKAVLATFLPPMFNFNDLCKVGDFREIIDMAPDTPGRNVEVQVQGSQPFKIGGALEQVLVSAAEEGSILFVHRSRKGDAYVIGLSSSVDEIQAALPPAVLWDSSVPRCLLDGEAPGRKHEKGVLVWLFAHNKLFSLRWMGNNPKYYCSGKPCQHVKAFAKNIHSSRKRMHPPLAFSHECNSLSPEEKDLVGLLDDEKYKDIAEEVAFDTGDKQINMFVFLSTDLLTASKTDFLRVSSNELETRIVPGALGSYFLEVIKCRKDELAVEAEKARKERASAAKRQSRFRAAEGAGGPCSPSTTLHSSVHVMASAGGAGEVSGDSMATELYAPSRRPARAAKEAAKTCLKYITKPMHMPPPVTPTKAPNARAKRKHAQQEAGRGCKAARGSAKTNAACQTRPAWGIDLEALELLAVQLRSRASSAPARSSLAGHWVKVAYMDVYDDGETMWKKWLGLVLEHKPQTSCCSVFFCGVTFKGNDGTEPVLEPERRSIEEVDHQAHDRDSPFASSFEVMGEDFVRKLLGGD